MERMGLFFTALADDDSTKELEHKDEVKTHKIAIHHIQNETTQINLFEKKVENRYLLTWDTDSRNTFHKSSLFISFLPLNLAPQFLLFSMKHLTLTHVYSENFYITFQNSSKCPPKTEN